MSPDSKNDTSSQAKKEVDSIREAINGEIPVPTFLQLQDASNVRSKIQDAVSQGKYAQGEPVPADINIRLDAKKEDPLDVVKLEAEQTGNVEESEENDVVDTSTKKDLSNPPSRSQGNFKLNEWMRPWHKHVKPLVLRDPDIHTALRLPIWSKLRRDFVANIFASMRN